MENYYGAVHNHYGAGFTSTYIPAEKPYAVFGFIHSSEVTGIGQLIGTMVTGKADKEGEVSYQTKEVWKIIEGTPYTWNQCTLDELDSDPVPLGYAGHDVGIKEVRRMKSLDLECGIGETSVETIVQNMKLAGLEVIIKETHFDEVNADLLSVRENDHNIYRISVDDGIVLEVNVCDSNLEHRNYASNVIVDMHSQIQGWEKIGLTIGTITMGDKDKAYQKQMDKMLRLVRYYGEMSEKCDMLTFLMDCRIYIGTNRCFYDDFVMGFRKATWKSYKEEDIQDCLHKAVEAGLVTREGNIIQFSEEFEELATWKWILIS